MVRWKHHNSAAPMNAILRKKLKLVVEVTRTRDVGRIKTSAKGRSTVYRIIETG